MSTILWTSKSSSRIIFHKTDQKDLSEENYLTSFCFSRPQAVVFYLKSTMCVDKENILSCEESFSP